MSAIKARLFYKSLNPQQRQFLEDKTLSATMSVKNWINFLGKASAYDKHGDKAISSIGFWIGMVIFAMIASAITALIMEMVVILLTPVVLGVVLYLLFSKRSQLKDRDINNYLRLFFMPCLEMLRFKAGENAKVSATLDFRNPYRAEKPKPINIRGRNVKLYEPRYIVAKAGLLDGAFLEFAIADTIKHISYRNPRGKYKTKTKTAHLYYIRLFVPKSTYRLSDKRTMPSQTIMTEDENHIVFKKKCKQKVDGTGILSPKKFFGAIQDIYDRLVEIDPGAKMAASSTEEFEEGPMELAHHGISMPHVVWAHSYFDNFDYDNMEEGEFLLMDSEGGMDVFDS